ncbi:MAG: hypothetical protein H5T69_18760 [Chloroflexi bacterium]|nr:hypothetical protein [Chloroflexota bacterium]
MERVAGLQPIGGNVPPMVEITLLEQPAKVGGHLLLHLVNGAGHMGVTFYEPPTLSDLTVSLHLQEKVTRVFSLVSGREHPFQRQGGELTIQVPKLGAFEALKLVCA